MSINHVKNLTMGQTTDTTLVGPNDWNSNHSQLYTLIGNTTGNSTVGGTDVQFSGGNNITLSGNGSTIGISAAGGRANYMQINTGSYVAQAIQHGSLWMFPLNNIDGLVVDRCIAYVSVNQSSSSNSSYSINLSMFAGLYSKTGSTLSLATSGSSNNGWSITSNNTTANQAGLRGISCPISATADGQYWLGFMLRTAAVNATWATFTQLCASNISNTTFSGFVGVASNVSNQMVLGSGTYSVTTATAMPANIGFSELRHAGSVLFNVGPIIALQNGTA